MTIFSLFTLIGGLAFFLYGMNVMSEGLEKMAGGKLELLLKQMTSSRWKSLLLGAGITIAIQSSSALTVMLVGLVNSGIMQLSQTIGVIMGSNIGTTLTAWILSLAGIESENILIQMLKPENFSPIVALVGVLLIMGTNSKVRTKRRDIGRICVGFAVLMYGMELMKNSVSPLSQLPQFGGILTAFTNPLLGVLVGTVFTGIIQSSAASVGILQALSMTGSVTYGIAIPIIMGQNIGTCVTSLISSIGVSRSAKRVAVVHIGFNLIGAIVFLLLFLLGRSVFHISFLNAAIGPVGVAFCHTVFNVATTLLFLPFGRQLEKLATLVVPSREEAEEGFVIDERLIRSTTFAISECHSRTVDMGEVVRSSLFQAMDLIVSYDEKTADVIREKEDLIDRYEDQLGTFMVKLSSRSMTRTQGGELTQLLHIIGDFERIGDHAIDVMFTAREMEEKGIRFSARASDELRVLSNALKEIVEITTMAFEAGNLRVAYRVGPLRRVIEELSLAIRSAHIERLKEGVCTIESGFALNDLLATFERIVGHCSNIVNCMLQQGHDLFEKHNAVNKPEGSEESDYEGTLSRYREQYSLPGQA